MKPLSARPHVSPQEITTNRGLTIQKPTNTLVIPRPSSPREFFARIYGHLESEKTHAENKETKAIESSTKTCDANSFINGQVNEETFEFGSDANSLSSSDVEINEDDNRERTAWHHVVTSSGVAGGGGRGAGSRVPEMGQSAPLAGLPALPPPPCWFPGLPFHAGLSAFCESLFKMHIYNISTFHSTKKRCTPKLCIYILVQV